MMVRLFHTQKGNCIDYEDQSYDASPCEFAVAGVIVVRLVYFMLGFCCSLTG